MIPPKCFGRPHTEAERLVEDVKKSKYIFVAGLLAMLTVVSVLLSVFLGKSQDEEKGMLVVTSFYPVYIATLNVTDGVDDIEVRRLSQPSTGCIHDHQLTTQDMLLLEKADVLLINGAGMESYLDDVIERYPSLDIIDTSEGAAVLESSAEHDHGQQGHVHQEEEDEHDHEDNAHIWMNLDNYCIQIENIGNALVRRDESHKKQYEENQNYYIEQVRSLQEEGKQRLGGLDVCRAVSTHEAFSYFAQNFGWQIEHTINMDENTSLSAAQVSEVIEAVQEGQIPYVFTEEVYGTRLSSVLEEETQARTVILDPLVSGADEKDAYLEGMRRNIENLQEVAEP